MSKHRTRKQRHTPADSGPNTLLLAAALVASVAVIGGMIWWNQRSAETPTPSPSTTEPSTLTAAAPVASTAAEVRFDKLKGRWLRPDGGYILEVRQADEGGKLDAGYFNPKPIHVAQATASREGPVVKMFVELRDVNYPGSTYTLTYDPASDQLQGIYFQALQQQRFEVFFERMK